MSVASDFETQVREPFDRVEDEILIPLYQKFPVRIVRGSGTLLYDDSGKEYIDLSGGYGVAIVGHANPEVSRAISEQSRKLITCHGSLYNDARREYLEAISTHLPKIGREGTTNDGETTGLSKIYLCNSGAETNEAAIKFARKSTGRKKIIAFTGSYHGKTMGALSATWSQKYRKKEFEPFVEGFEFAPFGDLEKTRRLVDSETAAIIVEPIQGESGIHIPPDDFLPGLRKLADQKGSALIFDEVQSGFGRTGKLWACENWDCCPDILTAAKGIAGGVPFGFVAVTRKVSESLKVGDHTSTFGGNPLACAAAKAALDFLLRDKLLEKAKQNGLYFKEKLQQLQKRHPSIIREIRGMGLMLAAELKIPVKDVIISGYKEGLILLYSGINVLRFLPPLVITRDQIDLVIERLDWIMSSIDGTGQPTGDVERKEEEEATSVITTGTTKKI
jgi:acetylornithine/LysW-gamma-L-lysine aminotransferase